MMNQPEQDLSEQYLVECHTPSNGCYGGYPSLAFDFVKYSGLPK